MLVWQDMPSMNSYIDTGKRPVPPREDAAYIRELEAMVKTHWNSPCIISWVIFNEGQGAHSETGITQQVQAWDNSRLVNSGSGGPFAYASDILDFHSYPPPTCPPYTGSPHALVCGEYGGIGYIEENHYWEKGNPYEMAKTYAELLEKYTLYGDMLIYFKGSKGLSAAVYTEITDVEMELNGLMTYDRKVIKGNAAAFAEVNQRVINENRHYEEIIPTSEERPQSWKYRASSPTGNWYAKDYNDAAWQTGNGGFGTEDTPGAIIGTEWNNSNILLRRKFNLPADALDTGTLMFRLHHDEDCKVYINGVQVLSLSGYTSGYAFYEITAVGKAALNVGGENTLAVHCHQTSGGQYIDVGISKMTLLLPTELAKVEKPVCRLYPNPAKNSLNIVREQSDTEITGIYNLLGSLVKSPGSYDTSVDISGLAKGMYFLRLKTGNIHNALAFIKE
jgi:hypothetical protein